MGRTLRLESDSPMVLERTRSALAKYGGATSGACDFLWRLVIEPSSGGETPCLEMAALSDGRLSFVNVGQRTFIAVDLEAREAVGFVEERFAKDELGFERLFLAALATLTAPALGLTPVPAACVAQDGRGVLIFAPPLQGKTILGYFARRQGLELHADDFAFLEPDLRVWGGLWPIAFHEEASDLWPELLEITRPLASGRNTWLCWNQGAGHNSAADPVPCRAFSSSGRRARALRWLGSRRVKLSVSSNAARWSGKEVFGRRSPGSCRHCAPSRPII